LRNPKLQGKCVCVGNNHDIILASSYEAKRFGVKTGTASRDAKKILGNKMVLIEPDFWWYARVSERLQQLLREFSLGIEVFSIDEMFVEITGYAERYGLTREKFAYYLKLKIKKEIGIPTSIGVGRSKIIAKLLSDINKPFGQCDGMDETLRRKLFASLPVSEVCFIGKQRTERLRWYARTIEDFCRLDQKRVQKILGMDGVKVWLELHQCDIMSFQLPSVPKNITRSRSFHPHFTKDHDLVWTHLLYNINKAYDEMMNHGLATRTISILLRDKDFRYYKREIPLQTHTNDKPKIIWHCKKLFQQAKEIIVERRTTGVNFGDLKDIRYVPTSDLFSYHIDLQQKKLHDTKLLLNKKFGKEVLISPSTLQLGYKHKWAMEYLVGIEVT
jgi:DNA polymerase-4